MYGTPSIIYHRYFLSVCTSVCQCAFLCLPYDLTVYGVQWYEQQFATFTFTRVWATCTKQGWTHTLMCSAVKIIGSWMCVVIIYGVLMPAERRREQGTGQGKNTARKGKIQRKREDKFFPCSYSYSWYYSRALESIIVICRLQETKTINEMWFEFET